LLIHGSNQRNRPGVAEQTRGRQNQLKFFTGKDNSP
jgi:hypothetical protein